MRSLALIIGCGVAWAPAPLLASDGSLPRTPVLHLGETCLTVVDRTVEPVVHLAYTIPFADTCVGSDELPDSRTHQFVAFCRSATFDQTLPHWLSWSDVDRAATKGLLPMSPAPADVLEGHPAWEDCWYRIVADSDRRTIDCDHALDGIRWDTRAVPVGAYIVAGYTFDPPLNMWVLRRGVIKVIDGDLDVVPAAAIAPHPMTVGTESVLPIDICVDGAAGSVARLYWAELDGGAPSWSEAAVFDDVGAGTHPVALTWPGLPGSRTIGLKIEIEDPSGRSFTYHSPQAVTVVPGAFPPSGGTEPGYDYCREDPNAGDPQDCGAAAVGSSSGCGVCRVAASNGTAAWWLMVLVLVRARPRSRTSGGRIPPAM